MQRQALELPLRKGLCVEVRLGSAERVLLALLEGLAEADG